MAAAGSPAETRSPAVAGRFYAGTAAALAQEVEHLLAGVPATPGAMVPKMLLVPHAGYLYSGPIAAQACARLRPARGRLRRVVLLGPTHRVALRGIAVPQAAAFATPMGRVPVDRDALAAIDDLPQVVASDTVHAEEHALEVQLPFLQRVLGDFTLVPLAVGRADAPQVAEVLERLWGGDETLVVVSSDLSHYLPYDVARARDRATIDRVLRLDPGLDHDEACGATPLAGALLVAQRRHLVPRLLDLRNSGDTAGDRRRVVGYAAVAFETPPAVAARAGDAAAASPVAGRDASDAAAAHTEVQLGAALLARARNVIAAGLGLAMAAEPEHPALATPGASFVTLRREGELRGCIGSLQAHRALGDDVRAHAMAAAFADPRFDPLAPDEYVDLEIEVSVLGTAEWLAAASEAQVHRLLRPGIDGVILEWRGRRATFLPQVWEQLPEPADFLRALKRKAGLPADFWAADLRLARYAVRKFVEQRAPADEALA